MISAETIAELEALGMDYILGAQRARLCWPIASRWCR